MKKTLIIGATENTDRYANRAAQRLLAGGHSIEQIGLRKGEVRGVPIQTGLPELADIDTITLYVGPQNQAGYYEYIKKIKPRRVIFNPGAENPPFERELQEMGIEPLEACTLVMLAVGDY
jgi:uncharacterized protein